MSGIDEQKPKIVCEKCGHDTFYRIEYGSKIEYVTFNEDGTNSFRETEWESDDDESWMCDSCLLRPSREITNLIDTVRWNP